MPLWLRVQKDDAIIYRPDSAHPVLSNFAARLDPKQQAEFANLVGLLGSTVPIAALHADFSGNAEKVTTEIVDYEAARQMAAAIIPRLFDQGHSAERVVELLRQIDPFRDSWGETSSIVEDIARENVRNA